MNPPTFEPGQRVNWQHVPRAGYALPYPVAAVVRKIGPKRIQIEVRVKPPYSRSPLWESQLKWVQPEHLTARALPCAAFREPMQHEHLGFRLTGWKHPNGVSKAFPNGTWYPAVDGHTCGAPCTSEERAVQDALHCLTNGGYRVSLLDSIHVREHWIATEQDKGGKGAAELPELRQRLSKVEACFPSSIAEKALA